MPLAPREGAPSAKTVRDLVTRGAGTTQMSTKSCLQSILELIYLIHKLMHATMNTSQRHTFRCLANKLYASTTKVAIFFLLSLEILHPTSIFQNVDAKNTSRPDLGDKDRTMSMCHECNLVSQSIEDIIRKPRQMDSYGQIDSRIDLDKIKKGVCKDIMDDSERESCRNFYFTQQLAIEKWKQSNAHSKFHDFVCIKELKVCCPRNSFGPTCNKCPTCNHNEQCHGDGTRSGSGKCVCKEGHTGPRCTSCSLGYYSELETLIKDSPVKRVICKPCHKSCASCRQAGPLNCEVCKKGFAWYPSYGCSDIDECLKDEKVCGSNTFCVNTVGSYFCYECDRACDGCHGDGPDMCLRCAQGYKLVNGNCEALAKTLLPPEANYYRYVIYVGLCISTCIILHNNVYLASFIGLGVAFYIGTSEYVMNKHTNELAKNVLS